MPLPIIIGAAVLAAASYGAKKGYDGYQKHSKADEIVKDAKERYDTKKNAFDVKEKSATTALNTLGQEELNIGKTLGEFKTLADQLLEQLNSGRQSKLEISIPKHQLQKIENYSYTAVGVLGTIAGAGAAGAAAGFAVYGGVMALGVASTGTAISSLAGAAATNAALAAIGGGSLATGGLGIAGGTAILGAAIAAPVLAIAGWAYNSHGEEALKKAKDIDGEVNNAVTKLGKAMEQLGLTEGYALRILRTLSMIFRQFQSYFDHLRQIDKLLHDFKTRNIDIDIEMAKLSDEVIRLIENGYALATILVNLITTPIFKFKTVNNVVVKNKDGVPEIETDSHGLTLVNADNLNQALAVANEQATSIPDA